MPDQQPTSPYPGPPVPATEATGSAGETWISDAIVAKVAATAAREVDGVEDLRGRGTRRGWVRASERREGGALVRVEDATATISVRLVVRDGVAIPAVVERVRSRIVERVEFATGIAVRQVDIGVVDVVPPPSPDPGGGAEPAPAGA